MLTLTSNATQTPFHSVDEATSYLLAAAAREGVLHLSYWYLQYKDGLPDQVIWVATYDPRYMSHYMSTFTPLADPVIENVMRKKFVDWAEWFASDDLAQSVGPVATRYGITKFGISMPLEAFGEDCAIFSVNLQSRDEAWPQARLALVKRFLPFAQEFNRLMRPIIAAEAVGYSNFALPP